MKNKKSYTLVNFCEFDKYASESYCAIHSVDPNLNLGDITKVNEKEIDDFNMMVGGSPCQDFSVAGKQEGAKWTCSDCKHEYNPLEAHYLSRDKCPECNSINIEKTRSSLLVEWLRVLREKKPNFAIYENVKNIVGKKFKETFTLFEKELHEYGYNTYWKVLNAKDYGVPQNRERVYLIIIKRELDNGKFQFPKPFDNGIRLKDVLENEVDEKYYIDQDKANILIDKLRDKEFSNTVRSSGHGSIDRHSWDMVAVDNNKCINVGNVNPSGNGMNGSVFDENGIAPTLTTNKGEGNKVLQIGMLDIKGNEQVRRVYDPEGLSPTLNTMQGGNRQPKILQTPRGFNAGGVHSDCTNITSHSWECNNFVLENCEAPMPELVGGIGEINFGKQYRQGNRIYDADKTAMCLLSQPVGNAGGNSYLYKIDYRIRKLIPLECFRLMGFSDEDFEKARWYRKQEILKILEENPKLFKTKQKRQFTLEDRIERMSNSQLYKQAGNSIVVDVLYYIYVELYKAMPYLFDDIKLGSFFSGIGAFEAALDRFYENKHTICRDYKQ